MLRADGRSDGTSAAACPPPADASAPCRGVPPTGRSLTPKSRNSSDPPRPPRKGAVATTRFVGTNLISPGRLCLASAVAGCVPRLGERHWLWDRWWQVGGERSSTWDQAAVDREAVDRGDAAQNLLLRGPEACPQNWPRDQMRRAGGPGGGGRCTGLSWGGPADSVRARCVLIRGSPGRPGRLFWRGRRTRTAGWAPGLGRARDVQGDDASERQLTHPGGAREATGPWAWWTLEV